jgi:hypothetical protein
MTRWSYPKEQVITYESYRRFHNKENNTLLQACYDLRSKTSRAASCSLIVRPGHVC